MRGRDATGALLTIGKRGETADCGRGHACSFCPVEASCALDRPAHNRSLIERRLAGITAIVLVMANKGGVGKSTVAANLAAGLASEGFRVGLADADVHGPNAPRLLGLHESRVKVGTDGIEAPRYALPDGDAHVVVGSLGFFLAESDTPVVWRDAYKHDYLHHLIGSFDWGPLDFLVVDMPPGTGNELITLADLLEGCDASALLVSSADAVALQDTLKAARFCRERGLPVLGLVENMAGTACPHCGAEIELFPRAPEMAAFEQAGVATLARLPFATAIATGAFEGHPAAGRRGSATATWMAPVVAACTKQLRSGTMGEIDAVLAATLSDRDGPEDPTLAGSVRELLERERTRLARRGAEPGEAG